MSDTLNKDKINFVKKCSKDPQYYFKKFYNAKYFGNMSIDNPIVPRLISMCHDDVPIIYSDWIASLITPIHYDSLDTTYDYITLLALVSDSKITSDKLLFNLKITECDHKHIIPVFNLPFKIDMCFRCQIGPIDDLKVEIDDNILSQQNVSLEVRKICANKELLF